MSQVLVFGGSTSQGLWDPKGGWPQRLRTHLDHLYLEGKASKIYTFNLGISGDSSKEVLNRLESETKVRLCHPKTFFIFGSGGNDAQYRLNKKAVRRSPKDFKTNIIKIIRIAKKYSNLILFVGLQPVDESKTNPIPWEPTICFRNELLKKYSDIVKEICQKENVYFVEIFDDWVKSDYLKLISSDGLHPNSEGHKKIFEKLLAFLSAKHIINSL